MKAFLPLLLKHKGLLLLLPLLLIITSCGSSKRGVTSNRQVITSETVHPVKARVIEKAKTFVGTPYKYGGTTRKGMDCSGLIYTSYLSEKIALPRTSKAMAGLGKRLDLKELAAGDLLFFETDKSKRVINHVGLVVQAAPQEILFIHATTSLGVIITSLSENYWKESFVMARRVE